MKLAIIITLSLLLAVVGASILHSDTGYVLIRINDYRIELNLLLFAMLLILLTITAFVVFRFIGKTYSAPREIKKWQEHRAVVNSQKNLSKGFIALGEGEYKKAQKILTKVADKTDEPLVPLLAAANAAQQQGDTYSGEFLLNRAADATPEAKYALQLAKAEQYINAGNLNAAQVALDTLGHRFKNNPIYLRLQSNIFLRSENWDKLTSLLPKLKSKSNLTENEIKELEYKSYQHLLLDAKNEREVSSRWKQIPKEIRTDKALSVDFIHKLVETEQPGAAARHIEAMLNEKFDHDLANLYSQLEIPDITPQIKNMEKWLMANPDNANLHLGLGRLYSRKQLWVMAKESLEKGLKYTDSAEARGLLFEANEHINNYAG